MSTLHKWWYLNKNIRKNIINGPMFGFNLKNDTQTVLIFGENHSGNFDCGNDQIFFTDLFESLTRLKKCDDITVILELTERAYGKVENLQGRLPGLLKSLKEKYITEENIGFNNCKIHIEYANILCLHNIYKQFYDDVKEEKISKSEMLNVVKKYGLDYYGFTYRLVELINKTSPLNKIYELLIISDEKRKIIEEYIMTPLIKEMKICVQNMEELCENSTKKEIVKVSKCFYDTGFRLIELYSLMIILSENKHCNNFFCFMGALHATKLAKFLCLYFDFVVDDITFTTNQNCVRFGNETKIEKIQSILSLNLDEQAKQEMNEDLKLISFK